MSRQDKTSVVRYPRYLDGIVIVAPISGIAQQNTTLDHQRTAE